MGSLLAKLPICRYVHTVFNEHNGLVEVENILFAANVFKAKERVFKLLNFAVKL